MAISYPFNVAESEIPAHQPTAHGSSHNKRKSLEDAVPARPPSRVATPPPHSTQDTRVLSSHYVEEMVEKALQEQRVFERFRPTVLVAVCDDSLAPARILKHHQKCDSATADLSTAS